MSQSSTDRGRTRVLVLDSSYIVSQSLANALKHDKFEVVYAGAIGQEALEHVSRCGVDVALVSATLEQVEGRGYDVAAKIGTLNPSIRIVILVEQSNKEAVLRAFQSGARGLFGRNNSLSALSKCVERVHGGQVWANSRELTHILEALGTSPQLRLLNANGSELLAPREQEVVRGVADGLTNREIAERLGLSENTVKNYMFRIFEKLGISKRVELALYAASQSATGSTTACDDPGAILTNDAALFRWCEAAVERFALLPLVIGELLRDGRGTVADDIGALTWFMIAERLACQLVPQTRVARQELEEQMSSMQISKARAQAQHWMMRKMFSSSVTQLPEDCGRAG